MNGGATRAWLRAILPLLAGDLEEASRLLADDPAPWLMTSASATFRLMAAEMALARGDDAAATALLDDVEPRVADSAFHRYASIVHALRAEVLRRRRERLRRVRGPARRRPRARLGMERGGGRQEVREQEGDSFHREGCCPEEG